MPLLEAIKISKSYTDMPEPVRVLDDLDFSLDKGELAGIFGASGSGKSTFLHILGGLDRPSSGKVMIEGLSLEEMNSVEVARFRNKKIGFVFQFYHLLPEFTALENVMLPALISGEARGTAKKRALSALQSVGLTGRANHRPAMLSGGEQQRTAIARSAVMSPDVILADEPTGNLDTATGERIFEYLVNLNRQMGIALVIVTHNRDLLGRCPKAFELKGGILHQI